MNAHREPESPDVTFFLNWLRDGAGMINREVGFAKALARRGWRVRILSYFRPELMVPGVEVRQVWPTRYRSSLIETGRKGWAKGLAHRRVRAGLADSKLVAVDLPTEARWALRYRAALGYNVVYTYHGVADSRFYAGHQAAALDAQRRDSHQLLKQADRVLVVSDFLLGETSALGVTARRVYNGVELDRFSMRAKENTENRPPTVLFIGRYTEYKGALNLVRAWVKVATIFPEARLRMHGFSERPDYEAEMRRVIRQNKMETRVFLDGPLPGEDMPVAMQKADVFVNGSLDETFCMPLLEAQACGLPCVAFAAGGIPEVVRHGETGWLAEPGNISEFADHLIRLLSDQTMRKRFGAAARAHAEHFSYDTLLPSWLSAVVGEGDGISLLF